MVAEDAGIFGDAAGVVACVSDVVDDAIVSLLFYRSSNVSIHVNEIQVLTGAMVTVFYQWKQTIKFSPSFFVAMYCYFFCLGSFCTCNDGPV